MAALLAQPSKLFKTKLKENMSTKNFLFYVSATDGYGESMDLLVVAPDKGQAKKYWAEYYELPLDTPVQWIGSVPSVVPECEAGPIDWDSLKMD